MVKAAELRDPTDFHGQLVEFPGILHWAYQAKLPKSPYFLFVSMHNMTIENEEEQQTDTNIDEHGNYMSENTMPNFEEFITNPEKYGNHLHQSQKDIISEKNKKYDQKMMKTKKGPSTPAKPSNTSKIPDLKHFAQLKLGLMKQVSSSNQPLQEGTPLPAPARIADDLSNPTLAFWLTVGFAHVQDKTPTFLEVEAGCCLPNPLALLYERVSYTQVPVPWVPVKHKVKEQFKQFVKKETAGLDWREIYAAIEIAMYGKNIQLRKEETNQMIKCLDKYI